MLDPTRHTKIRHGLAAAAIALTLCQAGLGQSPEWNIIKPSTTGVPGEEIRVLDFDSEGNLWIVGRMLFFGEVGLAMLPASELPYTPLPGGGFDAGAWHVWSSVHHPIPSVLVHDMAFAPDGIIWLASAGGLTRFDRNAAPDQMWQTFNAANSPLILDEVRSVDIDAQGNLWLTNVSPQFSSGALFRFHPGTGVWTQFMVGQQLPWSPPWYNVNSVHVGASGRVYVTHSVLGGMAEYDGSNWVLRDCPYPMNDMLEDMEGNVWITTSQAGLWKWDGTSFQSFDLGSQGTVTALGMDPVTGLVYAGAWYGDIYQMSGGEFPVFFVNAKDIPGSIHPRPHGDVWINNYGGNGVLGAVRHFDSWGQLLEIFNTYNSGLPDYFVDRIQCDSAGNMWFATGEGGMSMMAGNDAYAPARWRNWGNHNEQSEPYPWAGSEPIYAMCEDEFGNIWMAGNGVGRWEPETGSFSGFWNFQNSSFGSMISTGITRDGDGTIWVGERYVGVWHYDAEALQWVLHTWAPPGWTMNDVLDVATDASGTLWVLTYVQLHRRNADGTWSTWDSTNSPLTLGSLFDLEPDPIGGIWVGVAGKLLHFDGTTWTTTTVAQAGWPGTNVTGVAVRESDGRLAVTTQQPETWPYTGGISVRGETGQWTHYTTANSPLTHWQVSSPVFDADGHLWASAMSQGVVQILMGSTGLAGDIDADGDLDDVDQALFISVLIGDESDAAYVARSDLNGDGLPDGRDVPAFVSARLGG